jgi:hypothetical protein
VKHRRDDGFHYRPPDRWTGWCATWSRALEDRALAAKWIAEGWCRESIFNLKLPMKKRWEEVERCRALIDEALGGGGYYLRFKQLYHDREEVTAIWRRGKETDIDEASWRTHRHQRIHGRPGGGDAARALRRRLPPEARRRRRRAGAALGSADAWIVRNRTQVRGAPLAAARAPARSWGASAWASTTSTLPRANRAASR